MRLPYDLIIFDLELNQPSGKIIEIGAVKLLRDGGIHPSRFSVLVNPGEPIAKEITELTTIDEQMMELSIQFPVALKQFEDWAKTETKNILLSSWGGGDITCLRDTAKEHRVPYPFRGKTFDAKTIAVWSTIMFGRKPPSGGEGLSSMLHIWDMKFEGTKHRALDDALNTALLVQRIWKHKEEYDERILKALSQLGIKR